jgi:hypothetical protein
MTLCFWYHCFGRTVKRSFALFSLAVSPLWYARGIDAGAIRLWNICKTVPLQFGAIVAKHTKECNARGGIGV